VLSQVSSRICEEDEMRWALWALAWAGCDKGEGKPDPAEQGCATGEIALEPGTGALAYEPLADGDTVTMFHGPQSGWHVETAGFVERSQREITILPTLHTDTGQQLTTNSQPEFKALVGYDESVCQGTFYNTRAFLDDEAGPGTKQENICLLEGRTLELSITVGDIVSGRQTTTTVSVVAALDPIDVPVCGG
jgi:hypothetical protein